MIFFPLVFSQVEIYEFEKTELNSQEEMEKQARQYAEEQLQTAQMELQAMRQAKNTHQAQMVALKQEFEGLRQEAARQHLQDKEGHLVLEQKVAQAEQKAMQVGTVAILSRTAQHKCGASLIGNFHQTLCFAAANGTRDRYFQQATFTDKACAKGRSAPLRAVAAQHGHCGTCACRSAQRHSSPASCMHVHTADALNCCACDHFKATVASALGLAQR